MEKPGANSAQDGEALDRIYRKVMIRIIPYIFICYIFNYLDRVNVGFAKLQMLDDLAMSEAAYGFGAGVFFLGYVAFGVPSNLMLQKIGARAWLAIIMVLWGSLSAGLMFIRSEEEFYVLRALTGAAEAGFFPGVVLYMTKWFPTARRGRVMALFMVAIPLSGVFGGPFSGWILTYFQEEPLRLAPWQWLFLLQGLPTVFLGIGILFVLSDDLQRARWITDSERVILQRALDEDERSKPKMAVESLSSLLTSKVVWVLGIIYFCIQAGVYAINFWLPTIIKTSGFTDAGVIGWLSAIPYLAAAAFMGVVGFSADRRAERRWHLAVPMLLGAVGLFITATFPSNPVLALLGLTIAAMGALTSLPMFWPLSGVFLSATAAAAGLAFINSLGQVAGFASPYLVGWVKDASGSTDAALYILGSLMIVGVGLVLRVPRSAAAR